MNAAGARRGMSQDRVADHQQHANDDDLDARGRKWIGEYQRCNYSHNSQRARRSHVMESLIKVANNEYANRWQQRSPCPHGEQDISKDVHYIHLSRKWTNTKPPAKDSSASASAKS